MERPEDYMFDYMWTSDPEMAFARRDSDRLFRQLLLYFVEYVDEVCLSRRHHPHQNSVGSSSPKHIVIVDVGANCGAFSLECSLRFPMHAKIYAFEPFGAPYECLCSNARRANVSLMEAHSLSASQIVPVHMAVDAGSEGARECAYLPYFSAGSTAELCSDPGSRRDRADLERIAGRDLSHELIESPESIRTVRLDEWMSDVGLCHIDLLLIDVGYKTELGALASLGRRLHDAVSFVAVVTNDSNRAAVASLLKEAGFGAIHVSEAYPPAVCRYANPDPQTGDWDPALSAQVIWAHKDAHSCQVV